MHRPQRYFETPAEHLVKHLGEELMEARRELALLRQKNVEAMGTNGAMDSIHDEGEDAVALLQTQLAHARSQQDALKTELKESRDLANALQDELDVKTCSLATLHDELRSAKEDAAEAAAAAKQHIDALKSELAETQKPKTPSAGALQKEAQLQVELASLRQELADRDEELYRLERIRRANLDRLASMKQSQSNSQNEAYKAAALHEQLIMKSEEIKKLQDNHAEALAHMHRQTKELARKYAVAVDHAEQAAAAAKGHAAAGAAAAAAAARHAELIRETPDAAADPEFIISALSDRLQEVEDTLVQERTAQNAERIAHAASLDSMRQRYESQAIAVHQLTRTLDEAAQASEAAAAEARRHSMAALAAAERHLQKDQLEGIVDVTVVVEQLAMRVDELNAKLNQAREDAHRNEGSLMQQLRAQGSALAEAEAARDEAQQKHEREALELRRKVQQLATELEVAIAGTDEAASAAENYAAASQILADLAILLGNSYAISDPANVTEVLTAATTELESLSERARMADKHKAEAEELRKQILRLIGDLEDAQREIAVALQTCAMHAAAAAAVADALQSHSLHSGAPQGEETRTIADAVVMLSKELDNAKDQLQEALADAHASKAMARIAEEGLHVSNENLQACCDALAAANDELSRVADMNACMMGPLTGAAALLPRISSCIDGIRNKASTLDYGIRRLRKDARHTDNEQNDEGDMCVANAHSEEHKGQMENETPHKRAIFAPTTPLPISSAVGLQVETNGSLAKHASETVDFDGNTFQANVKTEAISIETSRPTPEGSGGPQNEVERLQRALQDREHEVERLLSLVSQLQEHRPISLPISHIEPVDTLASRLEEENKDREELLKAYSELVIQVKSKTLEADAAVGAARQARGRSEADAVRASAALARAEAAESIIAAKREEEGMGMDLISMELRRIGEENALFLSRIESMEAELRGTRDLLGHSNGAQKLQYMRRIKGELDAARGEATAALRERFELEQAVRYLAVKAALPEAAQLRKDATGGSGRTATDVLQPKSLIGVVVAGRGSGAGRSEIDSGQQSMTPEAIEAQILKKVAAVCASKRSKAV